MLGRVDQVEAGIERLEEPHDNGGKEDNCERLLHETLGLVPHEKRHAAPGRQAVVGQLHNEGHRLASRLGMLHEQGIQHAAHDTEDVEADHHERLHLAREACAHDKRVHRKLGTAAHERQQADGHHAVAVAGQRARRHDSRHGAAQADKHGHDAAARQAHAAQGAVHDEGHARHVPGILQDGKAREQRHDDGQERKDATHARAHAVDHERAHGGVHMRALKTRRDALGGRIHEKRHAIGQPGARTHERKRENERHEREEARDTCEAASQDLVGRKAALVLATLLRAHDRARTEVLEEGEAHVGQGRLAVKPRVALHSLDELADCRALVGRHGKRRLHGRVALDELGRGKACGKPRLLGIGLHDVHCRVDALVQGAGLLVLVVGMAEVHTPRRFAETRHMQGVFHKLVDALVLGGRNGDDGNAKLALELVDEHRSAVGAYLVHHVEGEHHGDSELHELHGEIHVALDVGGIHDVDDTVGARVKQEIARDDLLAGIGRQRVHARKVGHRGVGMVADGAIFAVDRDAGEIAHMLVGTGELVEEGRLAAVLVTYEGKRELRILRAGVALGMLALLRGARLLAKTGMAGACAIILARRAGTGRRGAGQLLVGKHGTRLDLGRLARTQGELVAAQAHLKRVAHGRHFLQSDHNAWYQAHVEQVATQFALPRNRRHTCALPWGKRVQCHDVLPFPSPNFSGSHPSRTMGAQYP